MFYDMYNVRMDTELESFQINRDIPPPKARENHRGFMNAVRETLAKMQIGDSFEYPDPTTTEGRCGMVRTVAKELGVMVAQRKTGDKKYRAWRIG
jgi:hypothetical protein